MLIVDVAPGKNVAMKPDVVAHGSTKPPQEAPELKQGDGVALVTSMMRYPCIVPVRPPVTTPGP